MSSSPLARFLRRIRGRRMRRGFALLREFPGVLDLQAATCEPGKSTIVVLAPHMDDEVLGCGGTLARHTAAGADVEVVYLTDGRYGGGGAKITGAPPLGPGEITAIRKAEALQAMRLLGVKTLTFLDAEDTMLAFDTRIAVRLRAVLERIQPQIVYVPFFWSVIRITAPQTRCSWKRPEVPICTSNAEATRSGRRSLQIASFGSIRRFT